MAKVDIDKLWGGTADEKPESYDYYHKSYGEDWDIPFSQTEEEMENEEFAPMMNYFYPIPGFDDKKLGDDEIKGALSDAGSVTLIEKLDSGDKGLALTGGGMDLSWDICAGYINLGFLPPAHLCRNLPRFGGATLTEGNKRVIEGCRRSLNVSTGWNESGLAKLDEIERDMLLEDKVWLE